jgi:chaperonin GroES
MKVLNNYVLIKREPQKEKTGGGLIIPECAQELTDRGVVVSVGPGKRDKKTGRAKDMGIKKGDTILFQKHSFVEVNVGGEPCIMVRDENIYGVIEA